MQKKKKKKIQLPSSKNTDLILLAFNSFAQLLIFLVSYSFQSKFGKTDKLLLWLQSFGIDHMTLPLASSLDTSCALLAFTEYSGQKDDVANGSEIPSKFKIAPCN